MTTNGSRTLCSLALLCLITLPGCQKVRDEARIADRDAASFPAADENYLHDMDGGVTLSPGEVKGRNTWNIWTGGNDRFWDEISRTSVGTLDFLKTLSS